jgi:hypothetical protein
MAWHSHNGHAQHKQQADPQAYMFLGTNHFDQLGTSMTAALGMQQL